MHLTNFWPSADVGTNLKAMFRCELPQKCLSLLIVFLFLKGIARIEFSILHPVRLLDPVSKMVERLEYCTLIPLQAFTKETPPDHLPAEQSHYQLLIQSVLFVPTSHINTPQTPQYFTQIVDGPMIRGIHIYRVSPQESRAVERLTTARAGRKDTFPRWPPTCTRAESRLSGSPH